MLFEILQKTLWENTGREYVVALEVFVAALVIFYIFQRVALNRLRKFSKKTKNDADDFLINIIARIRPPFYYLIALYIASGFLTLPEIVSKIVFAVFLIVVILEIILSVQQTIDFVIQKKLLSAKEENKDKEAVMKMSGNLIKGVIWILGILTVFSNLGVNVTSLITGLGIGGIAVALALQNVLGDIFASISIFIDKPFKVGDFIIIGSDMGTVAKIGVKSTRITTLEGQELVVPNKNLMEERINNYGRMERRRVVFSLSVTYGTQAEKLEKVPSIISQVIKGREGVEFDRAHFKNFAESSLDFEVVYLISGADYNQYMDMQQEINLEIFRRFQAEGIEFAFPSRTVYLEKEG